MTIFSYPNLPVLDACTSVVSECKWTNTRAKQEDPDVTNMVQANTKNL